MQNAGETLFVVCYIRATLHGTRIIITAPMRPVLSLKDILYVFKYILYAFKDILYAFNGILYVFKVHLFALIGHHKKRTKIKRRFFICSFFSKICDR